MRSSASNKKLDNTETRSSKPKGGRVESTTRTRRKNRTKNRNTKQRGSSLSRQRPASRHNKRTKNKPRLSGIIGSKRSMFREELKLTDYTCVVCKKFVAFEVLATYNNKAYHFGCFTCSKCDEVLPVNKTPIVKKGKFLCYGCSRKKKNMFLSPANLISKTMLTSRVIRPRGNSSPDPFLNSKSIKAGKTKVEIEDIDNSWETSSSVTGYNVSFPTAKNFNFSKVKERIESLKNTYKRMIMAKIVDEFVLIKVEQSVVENAQERFFRCIAAGIISPHHRVGVYAMSIDDYADFNYFFESVIKAAQGLSENARLKVNTDTLPYRYQKALTKPYELTASFEVNDNHIMGCKFKFIRNLEKFPMMGTISLDSRYKLEEHFMPVFNLITESEYQGQVFTVYIKDNEVAEKQTKIEKKISFHNGIGRPSYTSAKQVSMRRYLEYREKLNPFTAEKKRFKLGSALHGTTIAKNWPHGAGAYVSYDERFRIYYNEEDHLKFEYYNLECSTNLKTIYEKIQEFLQTFEVCYKKVHGKVPFYLMSKKYGYVTSCPSKVGSGFTPSILLELPELAENDGLRRLSQELGFHFKLRYTFGERAVPLFQISPIPKIFETEEMIIRNLNKIIPKILQAEEDADAV